MSRIDLSRVPLPAQRRVYRCHNCGGLAISAGGWWHHIELSPDFEAVRIKLDHRPVVARNSAGQPTERIGTAWERVGR